MVQMMMIQLKEEEKVISRKVILIKSPNPDLLNDEYKLRLDQHNQHNQRREVGGGESTFCYNYKTHFLPVLRTNLYNLERLEGLIRSGPRLKSFKGVIITSSRSIDSVQTVLNRIDNDRNDDDDGCEKKSYLISKDWESVPFFVIGNQTFNSLRGLKRLEESSKGQRFFPSSDRLKILGQDETGSGSKLGEFIINHFDSDENFSKNDNGSDEDEGEEIRLLHLVGDNPHPGLSNTINSFKSKGSIMNGTEEKRSRRREFSIVEVQVYETIPIEEPEFQPILSTFSDKITDDEKDDEEFGEEGFKLEKHDWLILFSPNSAQLGLRFINRQIKKNDDKEIDESNQRIKKGGQDSEDGIVERIDKIVCKIGVIGPTTKDYLIKRFDRNPDLMSIKPDCESLVNGILSYDNLNHH